VAGRAVPGSPANVRQLGYRDDIETVYRAVDFTVMASRYEPFGLVGVESVLCGTPVLLAHDAGCAEVIRGAGQIGFDRAVAASFEAAVEVALTRWRAGTARLAEPRDSLAYDPGVAVHVDALLALATAVASSRSSGADRNARRG
jgi:glycosyltransferase involved in cell wall biosynthesis